MTRRISEIRAKEWITEYGIRTPPGRFASHRDEALAAFDWLEPPLVLKLVSQTLHKSDVGGVQLGIATAAALDDAIRAIDAAAARHSIVVEGYLVEEMVPKGVEVLVGGIVDAVFGPAVMVGLGGIYTEILDDVAMRICPISRNDALEMIRELRAAPLLTGARGREPVDVDALASLLVAVGGSKGLLTEHADRIAEVDLNPVIVSAAGAVAVDARIVLREDASDAA